MIRSLLIKDYALIENITVNFEGGLNIITGETGAGKSILIGALGLLLGERASNEAIRTGAKKSVVEGFFDVRGSRSVNRILEQNDLDVGDELIIRRELTRKGSNRCFVNDTPTTLAVIKEIGDHLVDLHGQHEHQSLLRTDTHIEFLDEFAGLTGEVDAFADAFREQQKLSRELASLKEREQELRQKRDYLSYQLREISQVNPQQNEDEELEQELKLLENAERLTELSAGAYAVLYEDEGCAYDRLNDALDKLEELAEIDPSLEEGLTDLRSAAALVDSTSQAVRSYQDNVELDPQRLELVRERIGELNMLKKKFGPSLDAVMKHREETEAELQVAEGFDEEIERLTTQLTNKRTACGKLAKALSGKRKKVAPSIAKEVQKALQYMGIERSEFEVRISGKELNDAEGKHVLVEGKPFRADASGMDTVEFFLSTNPGETPKPLSKVASGGEVSRIMLALKTILARNDKYPLLIFDEIDTGISGRIAQKVGKTMQSLAEHHQILAITHLAQIAGFADHHYTVEKTMADERMVSTLRLLSNEEHVEEVATLLSGDAVTDAALQGARELIKSSVR